MIENPLDFRFAVAPWYVFNFSELRSQLLLYDLRIFVCMYAFRPVSIFFQFGKLPLIEVCTLVCSTVITPYFFYKYIQCTNRSESDKFLSHNDYPIGRKSCGNKLIKVFILRSKFAQ